MAAYNKGNVTKRKFILSAYEHLLNKDEKVLTVRSLAKENGYSVAALYKHFESLDYLLDVASIRFLDNYLMRYSSLLDGSKSPLQVYINGWELFIECAFARPDVFYHIYWKTHPEVLEQAFIDYHQVFPKDDPNVTAVLFSVLIISDDMFDRDVKLLSPLVKSGEITLEEAKFLSASNELIVSGLLWHATKADAERVEILKKRCHRLVMHNIRRSFPEGDPEKGAH